MVFLAPDFQGSGVMTFPSFFVPIQHKKRDDNHTLRCSSMYNGLKGPQDMQIIINNNNNNDNTTTNNNENNNNSIIITVMIIIIIVQKNK